jgi:GAF domain-containing protein
VPRWHTHSVAVSLDLLVLALVVAVMASGSAQRLINRVIDPYLHRGRIDYASGIRQATRRLSQLMEPADLALELRSIMSEVFVPESFAMAISPPDGVDLELLPAAEPTATGSFPSPQTLAALRAAAPSRSVLVTNRYTGAGLDPYQEALNAAGIEVAIPLRRRSQLLGLVLLGPRRSGDAYFTADLAFAESIAEVASIALENALLYRQRIQMLEYSDRLLESLDSAVVAVDASGRVTSFNPAARTLLGLASSTGQTLDHLPPEVAWALAVAVRTTWRPHEIEATIEHPTRGGMPVILSTAVLHDTQLPAPLRLLLISRGSKPSNVTSAASSTSL